MEDEEHGSEMEEGDISEEESLIIRRQFHKSMEERTYGRRLRAAESALMTELIEKVRAALNIGEQRDRTRAATQLCSDVETRSKILDGT